jgi:hypothetical protein
LTVASTRAGSDAPPELPQPLPPLDPEELAEFEADVVPPLLLPAIVPPLLLPAIVPPLDPLEPPVLCPPVETPASQLPFG